MSDRQKDLAARKAVEYIQDGMVVGLGTGSTAEFAIRALGERVASEGIEVQCVPTSEASAALGEQLGLDIRSLEDNPVIDLTIDGADEVDPDLNLIKGLGGALLREKIVAAASTREVIIIDSGKLVDRLGTRSPLPVEVIPFAWGLAQLRLMELCHRAELRSGDDNEPYMTDNGNFILDCHFPDGLGDAANLDGQINQIPGVIENGLFVGLTDIVVVGLDDGQCRVMECNR
jgi:ribose 5-phosphate isomerase A